MAKENNFIEQSIDIYIDYSFLPVDQYASIIKSTNKIYNQVVRFAVFDDIEIWDEFDYPFYYMRSHSFPLCIEEINTGNSINTKFSIENRFLPGFSIENGDTLKIAIPKWSAAIILAGQILSYGMDKYEQYLDIRVKELDEKIKNIELRDKTKEELLKQSAVLQEAKKSPNNPVYTKIQKNYYSFQTKIQQSNINVVEINGIGIKGDSIQ